MPNQYFIRDTGLIKASGKDLIDFINRMSTNDFKKLPPDEFRKTVLTTDKGRIIDLVNVLNFNDQPVILTSDSFQDKIISHLDKYIIMDDVRFEKGSGKYAIITITGDDLHEIAKNVFTIAAEKNRVYKIAEDEIFFPDDFKVGSLNVVCKKENLKKYEDLLKDINTGSTEEYEYMRIEAGIPEGENELNENINPMECGLDRYISFTKGCYIGQEVIARLDSQGKRPKQIVKIESENEIKKDDKIFSEDKEAGFISSVISHNGKHLALGFIRSVSLDFDKDYFVQKSDGEKLRINISKIN